MRALISVPSLLYGDASALLPTLLRAKQDPPAEKSANSRSAQDVIAARFICELQEMHNTDKRRELAACGLQGRARPPWCLARLRALGTTNSCCVEAVERTLVHSTVREFAPRARTLGRGLEVWLTCEGLEGTFVLLCCASLDF